MCPSPSRAPCADSVQVRLPCTPFGVASQGGICPLPLAKMHWPQVLSGCSAPSLLPGMCCGCSVHWPQVHLGAVHHCTNYALSDSLQASLMGSIEPSSMRQGDPASAWASSGRTQSVSSSRGTSDGFPSARYGDPTSACAFRVLEDSLYMAPVAPWHPTPRLRSYQFGEDHQCRIS